MENGSCSKAEIDTSAPFRSVKEAVVLFGERVLANQLNHKQLKTERSVSYPNPTSELEESLRKARLEGDEMARNISELQQELHNARLELEMLKTHNAAHDKYICESQIHEDVKFVEEKRFVTFANPPVVETTQLRRHSSVKLTRKKNWVVIPSFFRGLFPKKTNSN